MSCPICHKPQSEAYKPFCSKRCADLDLGKWLKGDYSVSVMEEDDDRERAVTVGPHDMDAHRAARGGDLFGARLHPATLAPGEHHRNAG